MDCFICHKRITGTLGSSDFACSAHVDCRQMNGYSKCPNAMLRSPDGCADKHSGNFSYKDGKCIVCHGRASVAAPEHSVNTTATKTSVIKVYNRECPCGIQYPATCTYHQIGT